MKSNTYRPDIDGLRAIAIIPVVLFHAFPKVFPSGFIGVDIFFVISGFLISTIIFSALEQSSFSFKDFYLKRIRRIFPALITVLACALIVAWFTLLSDDFQSLGNHVWRGVLFISNFLLWRESGYFDSAAETKPLLHLWSLSIEEQFYLIWPLTVWLIWKFRKSWLIYAIALIFCISFLCNVLLIQKESIAVFYNPLTRFWELLVGAILAYQIGFRKIRPLSNINATSTSILGLLLIIAGLALLNKSRLFPGWWALLPSIGAYLLILSGPNAWVNKKILSQKTLVWFGLISFPLYLWHWPLFAFAHIFYGSNVSPRILLTLLCLSIFLAWATYQFIEKPIRSQINPSPASTKIIFILVAIGVAGLVIFKQEGIPWRFPSIETEIATLNWKRSNNNTEVCKLNYPSEQYCISTNEKTEPTAVIIGDSHANHFFLGLSQYLKNKGGNLLNLGYGACGPFMDLDRIEVGPNGYLNCYKKMEPIFNFILESNNVKTVFLAFHYDEYDFPNAELRDVNQPQTNGNEKDLLKNSLIKTIRAFSASGKEVVLIYDLPNLKRNTGDYIKQCFYTNLLNIDAGCIEEDIKLLKNQAKYDALVNQLIKETSLKVFDTRPYAAENFPLNKNGEWTYRDYQHLTEKGSLFFSDKYKW